MVGQTIRRMEDFPTLTRPRSHHQQPIWSTPLAIPRRQGKRETMALLLTGNREVSQLKMIPYIGPWSTGDVYCLQDRQIFTDQRESQGKKVHARSGGAILQSASPCVAAILSFGGNRFTRLAKVNSKAITVSDLDFESWEMPRPRMHPRGVVSPGGGRQV
ncbi:hypothetical protein BS50DRAFT_380621 [Corynespora cassiicola Philippines]|uniref:Uncharacterized protein n=1 Tax=Corynespora cassiicola Philippines TaxID=1448308 RepID=A0A2T2NNN7_CORCC|nr:hypothetical protein BS50DRAFT_380621 [Corynespora cassiicola Philippines]